MMDGLPTLARGEPLRAHMLGGLLVVGNAVDAVAGVHVVGKASRTAQLCSESLLD